MSSMSEYVWRAESQEQKDLLQRQWRSAVEQREITCPCGQARALELAYRCLYCGIWFCTPCAEGHFGKTLQEWIAQKRAEHRAAAAAKILDRQLLGGGQ